jgi:DeoR/GlpR family transcriptional regulator of sugar metabolism
MTREQRHARLLEAVQATGRVRVSDMATSMQVSEMTVRRDLEELEGRGALTRVHGGAISNVSRSFEPGFAARSGQHADAKQRIGIAASQLVRDGETVIIDAGTTTLQVAQHLGGDVRIRAMALSLFIADALADLPNVTLMIPSAQVHRFERSFIGSAAVTMIGQLTFDTAFVTVGGVDAVAGVTEYDFDDAETKKAALRSARRKVVVADSSKLGAVAFVRLCQVGEIDILVTDSAAPPEVIEALRAANVEVILAGGESSR